WQPSAAAVLDPAADVVLAMVHDPQDVDDPPRRIDPPRTGSWPFPTAARPAGPGFGAHIPLVGCRPGEPPGADRPAPPARASTEPARTADRRDASPASQTRLGPADVGRGARPPATVIGGRSPRPRGVRSGRTAGRARTRRGRRRQMPRAGRRRSGR